MNHVMVLWLRFGTVWYGFRVSLFFSDLRARFVPVRFSRRRYGTVHPSIGGCTRTTPVPPDPYRRSRTTIQAAADDTATTRRMPAPATGPVAAGPSR
jgi:hypothetical protein